MKSTCGTRRWTAKVRFPAGGSTLSLERKLGRIDFICNDRNRFVVARNLLRELLGKYLHQIRPTWSFLMGRMESLPSRDGMHRADLFQSLALFRPCHYAIAGNAILELTWSTSVEIRGEDIAKHYFSAREVSDLRTRQRKKSKDFSIAGLARKPT
jgi:hypothetical protein